MSRRDTIIVAALINAGLLIVLFVSALKNQEGDTVAVHKESSKQISSDGVAVIEPKKMLEESDEPVAIAIVSETSAVSFVEDLQGLTAAAPIATAPQAEFVAEETSAWTEVKVKKGDMLEKIARHNHTTVAQIMKTNNLTSTKLKIGQVLKVPSSSKEIAVKPQPAVLDAAPSKFYTVKTGDSPWTIAVKNHMKVEELLRLYSMSEEKARRLKPGDQIRIR